MSPHQQLIETFYTAFQARDHAAMARCYHRDIIFGDPVFPELQGWKACAMWRMLCERGKDLKLEFSEVSAEDQGGRARWEARYTFSQSGLPVHNIIQAKFQFRDGLISEHRDQFDLKRWMGMALGLKGRVLGTFEFGRAAVRKKAAAGLETYIAKNQFTAEHFFPGH